MATSAAPDPLRRLSKFLSLVLRHEPQSIGLALDAAGWADVDDLLHRLNQHGHAVDRALLDKLVADSDKQRFALSPDGRRIRANQGHSVQVELGYTPETPPEQLFHGTATRHLASIRTEGLRRGERHHVHLSPDADTARRVGQRHGSPVVLTVLAGEMHRHGHQFFRSDNGVWLTESVPPQFLQEPA
ncbi:RNA 2'-phosphotransferase [Hymenobacter sp. 15J16-1T3B]|uniref:RNA 2'-phosphotransferase n=1 Tax=Hymenobacter sp. 15J16-1T3B TaxID=2886941 RepID=UPI001D12C58A|nr:RNA 2'-phosphotransferase [Hymenobacter sp. 15J16-1T3B]MCC3156056.1 RNA 2'-phosphotransferase [Hymenobacter sp. 15J16-1T3B]